MDYLNIFLTFPRKVLKICPLRCNCKKEMILYEEMFKMKRSYLLTAGAFVGVFSLGAMFAPIGKSAATVNDLSVKNLAVVQTANETDTPQQAKDEFTCPMNGAPMGRGMGMRTTGGMRGEFADVLGMPEDEFQAARQEGKTIAELAKEKGIKVEDLAAKVIELRKAELQQLVKDGKLTQEQVDAMLGNMKSRMEQMIKGDFTGPMHSKGMGHGGGRWSSDSI